MSKTETKNAHFDLNPNPSEVWGLWCSRNGGYWVPTSTFDKAGDPILAFTSRDGAQQSADWHLDEMDLKCEPRRIA